MICRKCAQQIPNDSEFCPYCGQGADKVILCPSCGKTIPDDSKFCPFCGAKTNASSISESATVITPEDESKPIKDNTKSTIKKKTVALVILLSILIALFIVAAGAYCWTNYNHGMESLNNEEYSAAKQYFDNMKIAEKIAPGEYELAKIGTKYEKGKTTTYDFYYKLRSLNKDYPNVVSSELIEEIRSEMYSQAVIWYKNGRYGKNMTSKETAYQYFNALEQYKDSSKYLILIRARTDDSILASAKNYQDLISIIDFSDAKEVLVSNSSLAWKFLKGTWKTSDESFYLTVDDDRINYNLPYVDLDNAYIGIIDGEVVLYSKNAPDLDYAYTSGNCKYLFEISVTNLRKIEVFCYKDEHTYTLFKQ